MWIHFIQLVQLIVGAALLMLCQPFYNPDHEAPIGHFTLKFWKRNSTMYVESSSYIENQGTRGGTESHTEWKGPCREILTVIVSQQPSGRIGNHSSQVAIKQEEACSGLDGQDISRMPNSPADVTDWRGISCLFETKAGSTASNRRRWVQGRPCSQCLCCIDDRSKCCLDYRLP